jgi:hypothetical protein
LTIRTKDAIGTAVDVTSAVLCDPTAAFGVERDSDNAVVVAANTVMTHASTGVYTYTFVTTPADGVYTWWVKLVYGGNAYYLERGCVVWSVGAAINVLQDSPAEILRAYLVAAGVVVLTSPDVDWYAYVSNLPNQPDNAIVLYDTEPIRDGKFNTGEIVQHFGVEVLVRSRDRSIGWAKINAIAGHIDAVTRSLIVCNGNNYTVQAVTRTSGPTELGEESVGTKRRRMFSLNVIFPVVTA